MFIRKRRNFKKKGVPLRRKATKRTGVSPALKKYVKKMIHVNTENKVVNFNQSVDFGSYVNDPTMRCFPILPYAGYNTIGQGITQGTRIGNEIKIRKVTLNYVLTPKGYDATTNTFPAPTEVELFLGRVKLTPGELPIAADFSVLFQQGASSASPGGNLGDLIADVNTDYWCIKKRWRHKIGYAGYTGSGSIASLQYYSNNDFKMNVVKKMDITSLCPKTLKFNDSNNSVQGPNLFFFYQGMHAQSGNGGASTLMCNIKYWMTIHYEDA